MSPVTTSGCYFLDPAGRTVCFRGINLSGNAKLPIEEAEQHQNVSFVSRPFPIEEARGHFKRLQAWGFNLLRFCVTWEAIEHTGPGQYDEAYIAYVVEVLKIAGEYGFFAFIDPHQDVWSRLSGGSGAPGWTFEVAGIDVAALEETRAAVVYPLSGDVPKMGWTTNYQRLACMSMFTLFFAGDTFAPSLDPIACADGTQLSVQKFLQKHFFAAIAHLAKAVVAAELHKTVVIGYDTLNEPSPGYIGHADLDQHLPSEEGFREDVLPTPIEGMCLANGSMVRVNTYRENALKGTALCNVSRKRLWTSRVGGSCIWARHGVWDPKSLILLDAHYFSKNPSTGDPVDFGRDFWLPFVRDYARSVKRIHSDAIIFVNGPAMRKLPAWSPETDIIGQLAFSSHWYDGLTLMRKKFSWWNVDVLGIIRGNYKWPGLALVIGKRAVQRVFTKQLKLLKNDVAEVGQFPLVIGEIGIPFDMESRSAYGDGDYARQTEAMDANLKALEDNLLSYTLWNYTENHTLEQGDHWNGEDLSIYSAEHNSTDNAARHELYRGCRAIAALVRPHACRINGIPLLTCFDYKKRQYDLQYCNRDGVERVTEVILPRYHYRELDRISVSVSDGSFSIREGPVEVVWVLEYLHGDLTKHSVTVTYA